MYTWRTKQPVFCKKDVTCHVYFQLVSLFWNPKDIFLELWLRSGMEMPGPRVPFSPSAFPSLQSQVSKWKILGNSFAVQWFGLSTLTARGLGSIPLGGTKILYAEQHAPPQKKKLLRKYLLSNISNDFVQVIIGERMHQKASFSLRCINSLCLRNRFSL